jgi:hypothetical protein
MNVPFLARSRTFHPLLLGAACVTLAAPTARAQLPLHPNDQVRLFLSTEDEPPLVAGSLVLYNRDSITIVPRHAVFPRGYPLARIVRLQVNRGRPPALVYGAPLYGALLGGWFGATALAPDAECAAGAADPDCRWETSRTLVGAAGGAVLFAMVVQLLVPEVWRDVPLAVFGATSGLPGSRGPSIGFSLRVW